MQKVKVKGHSVQKLEWKQIALPPVLTLMFDSSGLSRPTREGGGGREVGNEPSSASLA